MKIHNALVRWYSQGQGKNFRSAKAAIAHEFGHVFGLGHQQYVTPSDQREDRNSAKGSSTNSMSSAYTFPKVAMKYGFAEIEAYNELNSFRVDQTVAYEVRRSHGNVYDCNSIMHYASDMGDRTTTSTILRTLISRFDAGLTVAQVSFRRSRLTHSTRTYTYE
ncbi:hypothetical protein PSPO01_01017 [Paraphaeosphaeria sporulosa]